MQSAVCVYVINVDWYFDLHWKQRARALKKCSQTVHIIMAATQPEIFKNLQVEGFICHAWDIDRKSINPLVNFKRYWKLYRLLKTLAPDLIHAITIKPNIFVGLMSYCLKIPYVLSVTGTGIIFSGQTWKIKSIRPLIRFLYQAAKYSRVARKVIFENRDDRDYFVNTGLCNDQEAITILGAGVDTELFSAQPPPNNEHPVILFAARLLWDKGLGDLVTATEKLHQKGLKFSLQIAGIIDQHSLNAIDIKVIKQWHESGKIIWLGTESNMPKLLSNCDIVVLPTFYGEGVPRVLIEAAASARPIVATDIAGCKEIVQDQVNGLLVSARDISALANALEKLINNPKLCENMGRKGRETVVEHFSEQQVITETMALYDNLLI